MDASTIVIRVPTSDTSDLTTLRDQMPDHVTLIQSRAFDGTTVIQALVVVTVAGLHTLRAWLTSRAERQKATTVSWEGKQLTGYSAEEVAAILEVIHRSLPESDRSSLPLPPMSSGEDPSDQ